MSWPAMMPDNPKNVYTTLPTGLGVVLGGEYAIGTRPGVIYRLVQATGAVPVNGACTVSGINTVIQTSAANQYVVGCNESGTAITNGQFFWMSFGYNVSVLVAAGVALNTALVATATVGQLGAKTGTDNQTNCIGLAASGGGGATAAVIGR